MLVRLKSYIPKSLFNLLRPLYHWSLITLATLIYRFPARRLTVIGVTGTKGKSSTVELIGALLKEQGYLVATASTIRFSVAGQEEPNRLKMTMPGRFFLQQFLRRAVSANCQYAVIEMTSEGAKQYRHLFLYPDTLVFLNLTPEHIESHGSFENYREAKLALARALLNSSKPKRTLIANSDDPESVHFLALNIPNKITFSLQDVAPYQIFTNHLTFTWRGQTITSPLAGQFNLSNLTAAITVVNYYGLTPEVIKRALEKFNGIPGRLERITLPASEPLAANQDFTVIVDYAHTADSLEKVYELFSDSKKICVLGATGGGRDTWKRPVMGEVAGRYCDSIILTDDDSYDEDPEKIVKEVAAGITNQNYQIIIDRRQAIKTALHEAKTGDTVLITGKGTDAYLMGPHGTKMPWSDAAITREELIQELHARATGD
ncbi:MAG: UDP-N-acetylmuramyl-tripeptide synthetase [Candidatus Vogelbacteria bacterium]|nr:UDP-N-acetylmuramyl-tripeptide synthetase [Candidatus Vogelbacteria bacterium]